jgi:hypothetical protein
VRKKSKTHLHSQNEWTSLPQIRPNRAANLERRVDVDPVCRASGEDFGGVILLVVVPLKHSILLGFEELEGRGEGKTYLSRSESHQPFDLDFANFVPSHKHPNVHLLARLKSRTGRQERDGRVRAEEVRD